jgi:endonuclease/exonuclease/phosphatase family metal-dependent hydrolase
MPSMRLVTINILNGPLATTRWQERRTLVAEGLGEQRPDAVALQEVSLRENSAEWLADRLGGYSVSLCPRTGPLATREGIGILGLAASLQWD